MSQLDAITVVLSPDMASAVRSAVEAGDYGSTEEVVNAALLAWATRREERPKETASSLRSDIAVGLADALNGRVKLFDVDEIAKRGRLLFADRSPSS